MKDQIDLIDQSDPNKHNQKEKMSQEIQIHRSLSHPNVVGFHSFFDDPFNVYIVLELCKKRVSLIIVIS